VTARPVATAGNPIGSPDGAPTLAVGAGWITAAGMIGGTCGLTLAGTLAPRVGGIGVALAVIACAGVLAAVTAFLWLPETKGRELEAIAPEVA